MKHWIPCRFGWTLASVGLLSLLWALPLQLRADEPKPRPTSWAQPVAREGLPNLHRVTDHFYRGAQPTAAGMRQLHLMGIKTVINLRSAHSDRDEIGNLPLRYEHIRFEPHRVERDEVIRFLRLAMDPSAQPIFLHCQHGADRTGMMTALYRIVVQGWSKEQAIDELRHGGYGFHSVWRNLIRYLEQVDIAGLKAELARK